MEKGNFDREPLSKFFDASTEAAEENPPFTRFPSDSRRDGETVSLDPSFMIEMVHFVKKTLSTIKHFTLLSKEKESDPKFRDYSYRTINEDIGKIDSVMSGLLDFIHVSTPMVRSGTLRRLFDEALEVGQKQLQGKQIKIVKQIEKDLPETSIPDEQMTFIFDAILRYAILSVAPQGAIRWVMRPWDASNETPAPRAPMGRGGSFLLVRIDFTRDSKVAGKITTLPGDSQAQSEAAMDLVLELVQQVVRKNQAEMTVIVEEKGSKTIIRLQLPVERRRSFHYEPSHP